MLSIRRVLATLVVAFVLLVVVVNVFRIVQRKYYIWLPDYISQAVKGDGDPVVAGPKHILFFYSDHFEPGSDIARTERWVREYPAVASQHRDASGRPVQHTFFYHVEHEIDANLALLAQLVEGGYGEVEMHLHHFNNTNEELRTLLARGVALLQRHGFAKTIDGQTRFGFIHGNFDLDNSTGPEFCGADQEIGLLVEAGAYADFSFPAIWTNGQPKIVNTIYETWEDGQSKSYDRQVSRQLTGAPDRLVILPGPLTVTVGLKEAAKGFWRVDDANIHATTRTVPSRVDSWVKANIHVPGRPEWVFVKVWGHAASSKEDIDETLAGSFNEGLSYLESQYNDGQRYVLHYVNAREAYNVARAAADGKSGDPRQYFDYVVKPYVTRAKTAVQFTN